MTNAARVLIAALLLLSVARAVPAVEFDKEGVTPGKWTMDLEAARKYAKEKNATILLNFTGSDWCGWCKLMEKNVFSQQAWKDYAKTDVVMVMLDFPRDKSLVPAKYVARNKKLSAKYKVTGYPTYVLLDDDGATVLGRFGAGRDKTAESLMAELKAFTRYRAAEVARYTATLNAKQKAEYQKFIDEMAKCKKAVKEKKQQVADAGKKVGELEKKVEELEKKIEDLKEAATEFRAARLGPGKLKEYRGLRAKLKAAEKKRADWLATGPKRSAANSRKYTAMSAEVKKLSAKLAEF